MLRPQDGPTRERRSLGGLWRLRLDPEGAGRTEGWWRSPLAAAVDIPVPASYNDIFPDATVRDHVGDAWYQTSVWVPARWAGERIVLRFDAATHRATAWINDTEVVAHEGGYTPFEADVTAHLRPGEDNRVTVVVNNELTWESIPPGRVEERSDGRRTQRYFHDFFNYAGLHRSVWLYTTPRTHISDITVATRFEGATGVVDYRVESTGEANTVRVALRDASGTEVATATGAVGTLRVPDVHPWAPGDGYLYELVATLSDTSGGIVDDYRQSVGVRTVETRGRQFLINGNPFYFKGFGKHEDAAVRGRGHDDVLMVHDFALLEWTGANSFRTSHYPYAEEVLDYADRHGVVVIDETAAVGLNLNIGGGVFTSGKVTTFSSDTIGERAQRTHLRAIRELVARDKNHPSVVLWSIANEPDNVQPEARDYFAPLAAETRRLDPTRPVAYVNALMGTPDQCAVTDLFDVVLLNRYYGWYFGPDDLAAAETELEAELRQWAERHDKPIVITEYGADTYPGLHSAVPSPWTEEYQTELLDVYHRVFDRVDAVVGEQIWHFADFATAPGVFRVDGNKKGVFTRERRPKSAAFSLRARWRKAD
ncbi:beta-glucuronidase [Streptomyces sp. NPDC019937]|uniref:beta-glucuronidase n=1 Tax=Streptomyces sp. NPDC019937 TaxID=3154787 RepID=UPI0033F1EC0C